LEGWTGGLPATHHQPIADLVLLEIGTVLDGMVIFNSVWSKEKGVLPYPYCLSLYRRPVKTLQVMKSNIHKRQTKHDGV